MKMSFWSILFFLFIFSACEKGQGPQVGQGGASPETNVSLPKAKGHETGNGGGTWVCRNTDRGIRWLKFVDFFEAENEFGLTLDASGSTLTEKLDHISSKLKTANFAFYKAFAKTLPEIMEKMKTISNAQLSVVDDSLYRIQPSNESCAQGSLAYEQLANYTSYATILVEQKLWAPLTLAEQAALIVHETIYFILRDRNHEPNSVRTRRWVGLLFSTADVSSYAKEISFNPGGAVDGDCDTCVISGLESPGRTFHEGLAAIVNSLGNYKYSVSYIDTNGKMKLGPFPWPNYVGTESLGDFHEGLVGFFDPEENHYVTRFMDKNGKSMIPEKKAAYGYFSEGRALGSPIGAKAYYDEQCLRSQDILIDKTGKALLELFTPPHARFSNGRILYADCVGKKQRLGYKDETGKIIVRAQYESAYNFSEGLALVCRKPETKDCDFIDVNGHTVFTVSSYYLWDTEFSEGLFPVMDDHDHLKGGYIDRSGQLVIRVADHPELQARATLESFHDGLGAFLLGPDYAGYIDKTGNIAIPARYGASEDREHAGYLPFSEGLLPWRDQKSGLYGYIDHTGKTVLNPQFNLAGIFSDGLALVKIGDKWAYISRALIQ